MSSSQVCGVGWRCRGQAEGTQLWAAPEQIIEARVLIVVACAGLTQRSSRTTAQIWSSTVPWCSGAAHACFTVTIWVHRAMHRVLWCRSTLQEEFRG